MSKEAMKLALEALVRSRKAVSGDLDLAGCAYGKNDPDGHRYADAKTALVTLDNAITALREALASETIEQSAPVAEQEPVLQDIEQYRMQMAGICTAAIGYWKEDDSIHPDYDTLALRDVAKLYAKYDELYRAQGVSHGMIAGALFDFMGWLTTRPKRIMLSSVDDASPAVDAIRDFAKMRGLSLDDARVQDWQEALAEQPAQQNMPKIGCVNHDCDKCKAQQQQGPISESWHITVANGHSGYGVYAHMKDYPEEGAVLLQTIEQPAQQQEPVATVIGKFLTRKDELRTCIEPELPLGTKLYTSPPAQQEPVATFDVAVNEKTAAIHYDYRKHKLVSGTPLYTAPPAQRKPLTDEQITEIAATPAAIPGSYVHSFARAIEAAHGIKENTCPRTP